MNGRSVGRSGGTRESRRFGIRRSRLIVAAIAALGLVVGVTVVVEQGQGPAVPAGCHFASTAASVAYSITATQAQNAAIIAAVAMRKGMPDHAVTVALAASLQETQLRNLPYGDRDSVGLFQQRPSQGWGTNAQIMDPNYAASAFYDHLAQVPGWQTMAVTEAAQLVQQSATPDAYANWETEARSLARALTGEVPAGLSCRFDGFGGPTPSPSALAQAATTEMGAQLLGVPVSTKTGWQVAVWAVAHAYNYHVSSVSFEGEKWTGTSGTWSPIGGSGTGTAQTTVNVT
jgi:hypothetical protein